MLKAPTDSSQSKRKKAKSRCEATEPTPSEASGSPPRKSSSETKKPTGSSNTSSSRSTASKAVPDDYQGPSAIAGKRIRKPPKLFEGDVYIDPTRSKFIDKDSGEAVAASAQCKKKTAPARPAPVPPSNGAAGTTGPGTAAGDPHLGWFRQPISPTSRQASRYARTLHSTDVSTQDSNTSVKRGPGRPPKNQPTGQPTLYHEPDELDELPSQLPLNEDIAELYGTYPALDGISSLQFDQSTRREGLANSRDPSPSLLGPRSSTVTTPAYYKPSEVLVRARTQGQRPFLDPLEDGLCVDPQCGDFPPSIDSNQHAYPLLPSTSSRQDRGRPLPPGYIESSKTNAERAFRVPEPPSPPDKPLTVLDKRSAGVFRYENSAEDSVFERTDRGFPWTRGFYEREENEATPAVSYIKQPKGSVVEAAGSVVRVSGT